MIRIAASGALALILLHSSASAQQTAFRNYGEASDAFWEALYPAGFPEFYCGRAVSARENHNIEHVFPAFWMTKALGCGSRNSAEATAPSSIRWRRTSITSILPESR